MKNAGEEGQGSKTPINAHQGEPVVEVGDDRVVADDVALVHAPDEADGVGAEVETNSLRSISRRAEDPPGLRIAPGRCASKPGGDDAMPRPHRQVATHVSNRRFAVSISP